MSDKAGGSCVYRTGVGFVLHWHSEVRLEDWKGKHLC